MPFQPIVPIFQYAINACNDTSPTGMADIRSGQAYYAGGLNLGDYFDLTESEANNLSDTLISTLHAGRYRRIQVDSAATAANVKTGTIGLMLSAAAGMNIVTSYDKGLAVGLRPVVFLNSITPGNYGFIQELGVATVLGSATSAGDYVNSTTGGLVIDGGTTNPVPATIGIAMHSATSALFEVLLSLSVVQG